MIINKEVLRSPLTDDVYMIRYMPWFTNRISINVIYNDTHYMHDHPWSYFTVILWGGYYETLIENGKEVIKKRKPGWFTYRKNEEFHFLKAMDKKAITLFFRSKTKKKSINFLINGTPVQDLKFWMQNGVSKDRLRDIRAKSGL